LLLTSQPYNIAEMINKDLPKATDFLRHLRQYMFKFCLGGE